MAKKPNTPAIVDADHEVIPFEQGMTLQPGQSTEVEVTVLHEEIVPGSNDGVRVVMQGRDISYETFGRYTNCSLDKASGLWYADADLAWSGIRPGALPNPVQDTPELTRKALDAWCRQPDAIPPAGSRKAVEATRASYVPPTPVIQPSAKKIVGGFLSRIFK